MVFILVYVLIYLILRKAEMASQKNFQIVEAQRARMISSSKLASIGEMAGGIAHEINNPLMIIHGYAEQIQDSLNQKKVGQKEIYEASQKIIHTSKRISSIVASLKRLGSPQKSDVFEEASVTNIINDSLDLCRNKFSNAGIKLEFHPEMELKAICRSVEVSQAILNLLSNSYDAIEKTTDPWVIIKAIKKDQFVQISITDSGNGIKPEIATKIMEPFFTTKKEGRGTGLGLSISHRLIQDQNGSLFVDLKSRNTCFVIQIPSADKLKAIA